MFGQCPAVVKPLMLSLVQEDPLCYYLQVSRARGSAQARDKAERELEEVEKRMRVFHEQEEERRWHPSRTRTCTIEPYESNFLPNTTPCCVTFCDRTQFENSESDDEDIPDEVIIPTMPDYLTQFESDRVEALRLEPCNSPTPKWGWKALSLPTGSRSRKTL